ncbi:Mor transcription activator family protein [Methylomagnum ishizawai]|uniref:Mor transcription activator family protein n=1 Tax=Methylomagnum ishizawai TaxID=1760988 RepID=A0A1Y6D0G8_9GAMM|nr:Mor transcription activator family protein [Methylomagnum ishizawai]SMF94323.1 Mor transcription activator family protein [Methylomagnum ishizawai]
MELDGLDSLNWYSLPTLVQDIARRCGRQVAVDVLRLFDGRRIWVPVPPVKESTPLACKLGLDTATKLADAYPGQWLHIPRCYKAWLRVRNEGILAQRRAGFSTADLAALHHLTERQIHNIIGGTQSPAKNRQTELF